MKKSKSIFLMAGAVLAVSAFTSSMPASAAELDEPSFDTVQPVGDAPVEWMVVNRDTGATFTQDDLLDVIPPAQPAVPEGQVSPYLINDPLAYSACFGLPQNPVYPLASYGAVPFATGTIYLQCGPIGTKTFGWHHIQNNHQAQWETRVTQMTGLPYGTFGTPTWDDFMESFISQTLWMPGGVTTEYSGKRCYTALFDIYRLVDDKLVLQYSFNPTTILSMTNNRVITSYPSTNEDCSRQAPWW